jgi:hypothetical protein
MLVSIITVLLLPYNVYYTWPLERPQLLVKRTPGPNLSAAAILALRGIVDPLGHGRDTVFGGLLCQAVQAFLAFAGIGVKIVGEFLRQHLLSRCHRVFLSFGWTNGDTTGVEAARCRTAGKDVVVVVFLF